MGDLRGIRPSWPDSPAEGETKTVIDMAYLRRRAARVSLIAWGLFLLPVSARAQALNACDLNKDGAVNIVDVQLSVNMALGLTPCTSTVLGAGVCNIVVVQRVTNAVLSGTCLTGTPHSVTLNWTASTSPNVTGYNVYRGLISGGPYTKLNPSLIAGLTYTDLNVVAGQTYYYVATAVDSGNNESAYSDPPAQGVVPSP